MDEHFKPCEPRPKLPVVIRNNCCQQEILSPEEAFQVIKFLNSVPEAQVIFPKTKRTGTELFERSQGIHNLAE